MTSLRVKILAVAALSLLAAIATFTAVMLVSMHAASRQDEEEQLIRSLSAYRESLGVKQRAAEAILQAIAWRPDVRKALADHDRDELQKLLEPTFRELNSLFDIVQLYVHRHDGAVLLRVHAPAERGDSYVSHRPMIVDAAKKIAAVSAIDLDGGRLSRRTVVPVIEGDAFLGLLELGLDYDERLLGEMKTMQGTDARIWLTYEAAGPSGLWPPRDAAKSPSPEIFLYASTFGSERLLAPEKYAKVLSGRSVQMEFGGGTSEPYGTMAVPLIGYNARLLGVLEVSRSRAQAIASFRESLTFTVAVAALVAFAGIAVLAVTLNLVVLRPLKSLTDVARRQFEGNLSARAEKKSSDELGLLADTFNTLSNRLMETLKQQDRVIKELKAAQKAEAEASAAKDEFLAALSHELRTPLTPVLLASESLDHSTRLSAELKDDVHVIRRNVELEARLIDDLLDLTRITQDKLELHLRVCEVHSLLASAISVCQGEATAKGLRIETKFAAESQWVNADPARIQQVFWNLVKNAVKFTPAGKTISVTTRNEMANGQEQLLVKITDTGLGMTPEVMGRLFRVFEQGSRWITRTFGGLGLGLAISKKIVERHGGRIQGCSEGPGTGSTFAVWLPTVPEPKPSTAPTRREPATTPPLRILLVEDHPSTARVISRLLQENGHKVTSAATVSAAMDAAARGEYDLVISDLGLPDGDGTEMMKQLRTQYRLGGIAVSGFGMQDDITRSIDAGFIAHLTKPVTADQLRHAIADAWEKLNGAKPGGSTAPATN